MKHSSTLFLKGVVILLGTATLFTCLFVLPPVIQSEALNHFSYGSLYLGLYLSAIPFFIALFQAIKILNLIDANNAFSEFSVKALASIKYCAISISALFLVGIPYTSFVAREHNAPGIFVIACTIAFASGVIAIFSAVLQKLLRNAIEIKSENDLMI